VSRIGAATPIVKYVGSSPTTPVTTPIIVTVMINVFLRPIRSPMRPKMTAPTGRARNPTANEAKAAIVETTMSSLAKNITLNTSAAAVP
jgi:hypothetical protein